MRGTAVPALLVLIVVGPGFGETLPTLYPALYDVTGVAEGDVLNLRAAPDPGARVIGSYDPTASRINPHAAPDDQVVLLRPQHHAVAPEGFNAEFSDPAGGSRVMQGCCTADPR